jgi:hypothetical protein
MKTTITYIKTLFLIIAVASVSVRCKKLVQVAAPTTSLTSDNVYTNDATAAAVLTGIYTNMSTVTPLRGSTISCLSLAASLSADDLTLYGGSGNSNTSLVQFYLNKLTPGLSSTPGAGTNLLWGNMYSQIYVLNIALERMAASSGLTASVRQQLTGEAKFMRAFIYFYLVDLYGDIPLATSSDYSASAGLGRAPKALVYKQIIADLKDAQSLLTDSYVGSDATSNTAERVRPNKWTAAALLARTYLYTGDWRDAESEADSLINQRALYSLDSLNGVFLKNGKEAIWQLQPVNTGWNTEDAKVFILPVTGPTVQASYPVYLSDQLLRSFEPGDLRRVNWVDSVAVGNTLYFYPYKYKSATLNSAVTEYTMVFRLAEQYFIRAEARARQNNISGGQADLNALRARAGLTGTTAGDATSLVTAILHERQVELFTEWGHRWLDLKRSGSVDNVMTSVAPAKGTTWNSNWQYYPLPLYDITQDPNLVQNPGY